MPDDQRNTNGRSGSALPALKMKRQSLPRTISPRPNRSTCSTVISASSVDRPSPFLPNPLKLFPRTKWPITAESRFPLKNSADHGNCPEEFGSPLFADENTNSEMFRTISTRLWQRTFLFSFVAYHLWQKFFSTFHSCSNSSNQYISVSYQFLTINILIPYIYNTIIIYIRALFEKVSYRQAKNKLVILFIIKSSVATQERKKDWKFNDEKKFLMKRDRPFFGGQIASVRLQWDPCCHQATAAQAECNLQCPCSSGRSSKTSP